jgi:hypothetical protein
MKVLTSQEAFAYKNQLAVIREQMQQLEERGAYSVAGNIVKPSDRKEYRNLTEMEHHVRQLAAGVEKPKPYVKPKRPGTPTRRELTDEEWDELAKCASEAFKEWRGCADTKEKEKSSEDTVAAQETHVAEGD